jgi:hypothetical protein
LDDEIEQIQVTMNKRKYKNAEYDDNMIEYLMKYLGLESYEELEDFLKHSHNSNIIRFKLQIIRSHLYDDI